MHFETTQPHLPPAPAPIQASSQDEMITSVLLVFLLVLVGVLALSGAALLNDGDTSLHITVGRLIWESRAFPTHDVFSHTFSGQPWIAKEWLSQLVLYAAYALGSWRGVALVTGLSLATTYALLFAVLARQLRMTVALGAVLLAIAFSVGHFLARPHVLSFPIIVLWTAGLASAVERRAIPSLLLLPVMTVWANLHAGFTLGLGLAGVLALEAIVTAEPAKRVRVALNWTAFLLAAVIAACITPYGYKPLLLTFKLYTAQPVQIIREWAPFNAEQDPSLEFIMLALLALSLAFGARIKIFRLLILIGLIHLTLKHVRMASMFAIIAPIMITSSLTEQFRFLRRATHRDEDPRFFALLRSLSRGWIHASAIGAIALASVFYLSRPPIAPRENVRIANAVDFLEHAGLTARIAHSYQFAGYLILSGIKVFFDSRVDQLYSGGFFAQAYRAYNGLDGGIAPFLEKYDIAVALLAANSVEANQLQNDPHWRVAYSDASAVVFTRVADQPPVGTR